MNQKYMIYMYLLKARTFIALLLVIAFFSVMVPNFLTTSNLLIMTQHVAITGLLAIGMTLLAVLTCRSVPLPVSAAWWRVRYSPMGCPSGAATSSSSTCRK